MQAQIQQGNKIPSTRSTSIGKRFASAFFAVLLAFFLVPTPAFQIAPAYADELGEAVSAGLMESAQPADSPATPKVDTSTETVTQDKADPAPDTKDTAKGDASWVSIRKLQQLQQLPKRALPIRHPKRLLKPMLQVLLMWMPAFRMMLPTWPLKMRPKLLQILKLALKKT